MKQWMLAKLERALNRYLALDEESRYRLNALENKHVTIELLGIHLIFQLRFSQGKIYILTEHFSPADTYIKGTPLTLLRAAVASGDRKSFFSKDATIEGDLEVGEEVIALFDHLDIDWEEYLSKWMGDVSAHQVGNVWRSVKAFSQKAKQTLLRNVTEYTQEEIPLFPPKEALMDFYQDVDELRTDVDRLAARIKRLQQIANKKA